MAEIYAVTDDSLPQKQYSKPEEGWQSLICQNSFELKLKQLVVDKFKRLIPVNPRTASNKSDRARLWWQLAYSKVKKQLM